MPNPFQITALPIENFTLLFSLDDDALQSLGVKRLVADKKPGFPCRVSLVDAAPDETVLLLPFTHHDVNSPYRACGPIFVRTEAKTARLAINEIPERLQSRLLSIRAYDQTAMMIAAEVAEGRELAAHISRFFDDPRVEYLHLHNARPGCFNCRVERA